MSKLKKIYSQHKAFKRRATFTKYMESMPIKKNTVFYHAYRTRIMAGNPYAIFKELMEREEFKAFHHYWVYTDEDSLKYDTFRRYAKDPRVHFVKAFSNEHLEAMACCEYLVNNAALPDYWQKREGQIYINTWHGTPLKMLGKYAKDYNEKSIYNAQRNFLMCDYMVMPNQYTIERMLSSYDLSNMMEGKIIDAGYPRNDLPVTTDAARIRTLLEKKLGKSIENKKVVLYAPTFRSEKGKSLDNSKTMVQFIKEMVKKFPDNYEVFFKIHNTVGAFFKNNKNISDRLIFDEIETNELLAATDVLITDYSSIFFDYLCTKKPCLFFVYDRADYESGRGMYRDIDTLPGALCYTVDQLVGKIKEIDAGEYDEEEKYNAFLEEFAYNDDGHAAQRVVDIIFKKDESLARYVSYSKPFDKMKMLINAGDVSIASRMQTLFFVLEKIDYTKYQVIVTGNGINHIFKRCEKVNKDIRVLGSDIVLNMTYKEKLFNRIHHNRQMRKFFGNLTFDVFVDMDEAFGNCSRLFCEEKNIKRYAVLNNTFIAGDFVRRYGERYEKIHVIGENPEVVFDKSKSNLQLISSAEVKALEPDTLNILFLSAFDSMNYVFVECIDELKRRGHKITVVVKDTNDYINNKMYLNNEIDLISIMDFDLAALNYFDIAISSPVALKAYSRVLKAIRENDIFLISFSNLFSSVVMRVKPDIVFCIGENKIDEFRQNYLEYNFIVLGNPQYDELVRNRKQTQEISEIKKVLVIDQGGYPYGSIGKKQLADTLTKIAVNNPELEFEIKPRYLKMEQGDTVHNVAEYLQDYFEDMPDNMRFIETPCILEEIVPDYDAMISTWSTAFLDALMVNIPLVLLKGFDSIDVFDVRTQRIDEAYEDLEKTGCLYHYSDVQDGKLTFHYVDDEYIRKTIYKANETSAQKVVDFLEHTKANITTKGSSYGEHIQYDIETYFERFNDIEMEKNDSPSHVLRRTYLFELNKFMQETVYVNRCMGNLMDLSPLYSLYERKTFPKVKDIETFSDMLRKEFETELLKVQKTFFTSEGIWEKINEDKILQDFYFEWLFNTGQYDKLISYDGRLLAESSREYYLGLIHLKKNKKKAYEHLFNFCDHIKNAEQIQLLKEKRIGASMHKFKEGIDKFFMYYYMRKNKRFDILGLLNEDGAARNSIVTYFRMKDLNEMKEYDESLRVYELYNERYVRKLKKKRRRLISKLKFSIKKVLNIFIERQANIARKSA